MNDNLTPNVVTNEAESPAFLVGAVRCCYFHPAVGFGDFVKEYDGLFGRGLIIRLNNGQKWFAPVNEFTLVK